MIPLTLWYAHFRFDRDTPQSVSLTGTVRLNGEALPRALVSFHSAAPDTVGPCPTALANEAGWYAVELPPGRYHVTVENAAVALPAKYADPGRTPLQFAWEQLGSAEQDLNVQTWSAAAPQPATAIRV